MSSMEPDESNDTLKLLMWIEKLERKISKMEKDIADIKRLL